MVRINAPPNSANVSPENTSKQARYVLKVVMCGDWAVGKTSLVRRFSENKFNHDYKPSIGVNIVEKVIEVEGKRLKLDIWDTGGQERMTPLRKKYYKGAKAGIFVFDMTRASSAVAIQDRWIAEVDSVVDTKIPRLLLANKADLGSDREVSEYAGRQLAERINAIYSETSALDGQNVVDAFVRFAAHLMKEYFPEV